MKQLIKATLVSVIIAGALFVPNAYTENKEGGVKKMPHHEMTAEQWKEKLGITDEQAEKLKAAKNAKHEALKPLWEQSIESLKELRSHVENKASDEQIQVTLDKLTGVHKAIQTENEKFKSDTASFLTPTQRAKLLLVMAHKHHAGAIKNRKHKGSESGEKHHEYYGEDAE